MSANIISIDLGVTAAGFCSIYLWLFS